ncbi:hypothetical protein LTR22_019956 [Elasticomyces elasticus]|nr:hypothetical protein LTR22_019956 [Elasticomyces elasticus]
MPSQRACKVPKNIWPRRKYIKQHGGKSSQKCDSRRQHQQDQPGHIAVQYGLTTLDEAIRGCDTLRAPLREQSITNIRHVNQLGEERGRALRVDDIDLERIRVPGMDRPSRSHKEFKEQ